MKTFTGEGLGRVVVLNFKKGEKFLEGITRGLEQKGIKNAVLLSAIGTFDRARLHRITTTEDKPTDEFKIVEGPIELSAVDGMVINGEPHFHMVISEFDKTYSGHLEEGSTVLYLAEVVLAELKGLDLKRELEGPYIKYISEK